MLLVLFLFHLVISIIISNCMCLLGLTLIKACGGAFHKSSVGSHEYFHFSSKHLLFYFNKNCLIINIFFFSLLVTLSIFPILFDWERVLFFCYISFIMKKIYTALISNKSINKKNKTLKTQSRNQKIKN
jgi:hypothetical protein